MESARISPVSGNAGNRPRPIIRALAELWTTAAFLRDEMQDDTRSAALTWAAETVQGAMQAEGETLLTVSEAAVVSGASVGAVRRALASGALANFGERYRPRVRRGDLLDWSPPRGRQGPQVPLDAADASGGQGLLEDSRGPNQANETSRVGDDADRTE